MTLVFMVAAFLCCEFSQISIDQTKGPKIVFFGDSITELGVKPRGYVTLIQNHFRNAGSDVQIVGSGVSGNRVPDLLRRVDRDVLALKPILVIVYIVINNVWH